jgi:competence protein ComEC
LIKDIMSHIPGFRSGVLWKKIIATIYYLFALSGFFYSWGIALFFLSIPFVVFSLVDLMVYKKKGKTATEALIPFILAVAIAITGGIGISASATPAEPAAEITEPAAQSETASETPDESQPANTGQADDKDEPAPVATEPATEQAAPAPDTEPAAHPLEVHFIDVGQADSILVQTPGGKTMLIDAGNNADGDAVVSYIKSQGVKKIDVLVGTHPHEDHIGGMDNVINSFDIGKIYMPQATTTTKTYEDVLTAISRKGLKITAAKGGQTIDVDPAIKADVLAPNSSTYDDLNNSSIVIKLTYKNTSFLLAGDAEDISEQEMVNKGYNLKADVLKVGHHGSDSSTTPAFLKAVSPKYAVISVGRGNDYGHPAPATLTKLASAGIEIYRTDEAGTIIATSDGNTIRLDKKASPVKAQAPPDDTTAQSDTSKTGAVVVAPAGGKTGTSATAPDKDRIVYWTPKGKSYHYSKDCRTLSRSKTILSGPLSECPKSDPCDICAQ